MDFFQKLPQKFITNIQNTFGETGQKWLNSLERRLAAVEKRWQLRIDYILPDLNFNLVAVATLPDQRQVILKCGVPGPVNPDLKNEIKALNHFYGHGAVKLLAADEQEGYLLLEKIEPGRQLASLNDDDQATRIVVRLMRSLHKSTHQDIEMPTVEMWFQGLEDLRQLKNKNSAFPASLIDKAHDTGQSLLQSAGERVVLHGDLHHFNILSAQRQPWLAIDPKGVLGEAEYETGALLRNPLPTLMTTMNMNRVLKRRIQIIQEESGFDAKRVQAWAFYQAVLASWWAYSSQNNDWRLFLECAKVLYAL